MEKTILQIFASRGWGGGEQYVYDLSKRLIEQGNNVIFSGKKCSVIEKKIASLGNYFALPLKGIIDLYSPFKLCRIIEKYNVDIVHIHQFKDAFTTMFANILLKRKVKVALTRHLVKKGKTNWLYGYAYRSVDKIIFVSELAKNVFLSTKPHVNSQKILVIHNSIPSKTSQTERVDYRKKFNIGEQNIVLAFVGRLDKEKGLDVLFEALNLSINKNFILLVAGIGSEQYKSHLVQLLSQSELNDKVIFLDFIENVAELVQQVDIGIMPSIYPESFGLVVLEYMRGRKPVITSDNGAQSEYIQNNRTGILVPPNDAARLASEIDKLMLDENLRNSIGTSAREYFTENLSYDMFFTKILDVYKAL
ncbi:MAG: glycosyltransferase family 4 protein [Prevotellaceae bacterium]|jgi:glycosyltransferase involved in cell wall biosynthesis|nr:glycosyltransferase family 4 protein [Prevotellaceae bacterium]